MTIYLLSEFSLIAGQQHTPLRLLIGAPMAKPSSKGEINFGSDKTIASFYFLIIK